MSAVIRWGLPQGSHTPPRLSRWDARPAAVLVSGNPLPDRDRPGLTLRGPIYLEEAASRRTVLAPCAALSTHISLPLSTAARRFGRRALAGDVYPKPPSSCRWPPLVINGSTEFVTSHF